jgi:hypothetical protein
MRNRNKPHDPYDPDVLARLRDFYRPYNSRLAGFLQMDLDWDAPAGLAAPGRTRPTTTADGGRSPPW